MAVLSYVPPLDAPWITRGGASTTTVCKPAVIRHRVSCWRLGAGLEFDRRLAVAMTTTNILKSFPGGPLREWKVRICMDAHLKQCLVLRGGDQSTLAAKSSPYRY